jgi:Phosphate-selective porin O and P
LLVLLCLTWGLAESAARADSGYQLGHGYDLGPFNLAGYSNLVGNLPTSGTKSLALEDLSLFVTGHLGRFFNPFTEAELTDFDLVRSGPTGPDHGDGDFVLERLYNDSYLTDAATLRIGKMLTPVGEWNQIHAAPLVLTTVRPAVTERNFSEYATGVSALYSDPFSKFPDIQVYWQPASEFSERPSTITFHQYKQVEGAHVSFPIGLLDMVGVSFQQSRDVQGVDQSLFGADFHYTLGKVTLQGEGTVSALSRPPAVHIHNTEWGAYAAASYAFTDKWSAYSWYGGFGDRSSPSPADDLLFGVAYRPQPPMVFRVEYLQNFGGPPVNPTGVFASWAVLF